MAADDGNTPRDWKQDSLCFRLIDMGFYSADIWYQDDFTHESRTAADICFECPVRLQCLNQACSTKDDFGIWGGLPVSTRTQKGRTHNFSRLKNLKNPYDTDDQDSPYHLNNLEEAQDGE